MQGVGAVYISYYPDLAVPGAAEAVSAFIDLAVENGVRRLVLLSGRGEHEAQVAERALMDSGADWTILRCSWFNQNFSESFMADLVLAGEIALPAGSVGEPFVDADDIADAAVAAFTDDRHVGQLYELTGPRLLTFADAAAEIAAATGREIDFVPVSHERYAGMLAEQQAPEDIAWLVTYLFREVLDGRNAYLTDGVQRALGRPPRDFPTMRGRPQRPESGRCRNDRRNFVPTGFRSGPGQRADGRTVFRLLELGDGCAGSPACSSRHRSDELDQRRDPQSAVPYGVSGNRRMCAIVATMSLFQWNAAGSAWVLAGSLFYLAGIIMVTMAFNVPLNEALAGVDPASAEASTLWARYLDQWVMWNHVRTVAGVAALASFIMALRQA